MTSEREPVRPLAAGAAVEGAVEGVAEALAEPRLEDDLDVVAVETARLAEAVVPGSMPPHRVAQARATIRRAVERTKEGAEAVAETTRRARRAPPRVWDDVKDATKSYAGGLAAGIGYYAAAGLLGLVALAALSIALAQGLNNAWGQPWGTALVGLLYVAGAVGCAAVAKGRQEAGKREAKAKLEHAKAEARGVTRPVRRAFRRTH